MATANSIAGVLNGAGQIECTINGLGERAGNTSLEEVVMILKQHHKLGYYTNIKTQKLNPISALVSETMRMPVQPNKAIVGSNAFSHSSGIHQEVSWKMPLLESSTLKTPVWWFKMCWQPERVCLGSRFPKLGYHLTHWYDVYMLNFKVADIKKEVADEDLQILAKNMLWFTWSPNNVKTTTIDNSIGKNLFENIWTNTLSNY